MVSPDDIDNIRRLYINAEHPVFDLVPEPLNRFIERCYNHLDRPPVERASIWAVYLDILSLIRQCEDMPDILATIESGNSAVNTNDPDFVLIPGQDLHEDSEYLGGVANGLGLRTFFSTLLRSYLIWICLEHEHLSALDAYEVDEPNMFINEIDAVPVVWVDSFSSDDEDEVDGSL